MTDTDMVFCWLLATLICLGAIITLVRKVLKAIGAGILKGGGEDRPCYDPENPPRDPLEDECEAYLNRRPLL